MDKETDKATDRNPGIATIIDAFRWIPNIESESSTSPSLKKEESESLWLKIGSHKFPCLPTFIKEPFESVVFKLLSHSQLSVRENASRAMSHFLARSNYEQMVNTFKAVISLLLNVEQNQGIVTERKIKFMDACWAEGLLAVAEFLIKRLSSDYIISNWDLCMSVFLHYLMHPASTVRQAGSKIFKYLVSKNSSEPRLLRIVLRYLAHNWETDLDVILSEGKMETLLSLKGVRRRSDQKGNTEVFKTTHDRETFYKYWEWREGRMMAYELILKYLITNHIHYCFPTYSVYRDGVLLQSSVDERAFTRMTRYSTDNLSKSVHLRPRKSEHTVRYQRSYTIQDADPRLKSRKRLLTPQDLSLLNSTAKIEKDDKLDKKLVFRASIGSPYAQALEECPVLSGTELFHSEKQFSKESFEEWQVRFSHITFSEILLQILVQTAECFSSSQWELQRMAQQVLPLVSEVLRFYNIEQMRLVWMTFKKGSLSPMCYSSLLCLRESVLHAARLRKSIIKQNVHQDASYSQRSAEAIISCVSSVLSETISEIVEITKRQTFDRLSIVAFEIMVLSTLYFPDHVSKKMHEKDIVDVFLRFFVEMFKEDPYANFLVDSGIPTGLKIETENFLSFTLKPTSKCSIIGQVNETLFAHVQKDLLQFTKATPVDSLVCLFPVFLKMTGFSCQGKIDVHILMQCCEVIVQDLKSGKAFGGLNSFYENYIKAAAEECVSLLELQELDMYVLKHATEILLELFDLSRHCVNLQFVFAAVASHIFRSELEALKDSDDDGLPDIENQPARLQMLSNEIRQSPIEEHFIKDYTEEKDSDEEDTLPESQALGVLDNEMDSSSPKPAWTRSKPSESGDALSDWDSWESEQEDHSEMEELYSSFLKRLQWLCKDHFLSESHFNNKMEQCDMKTQRIIASLVN